MSNVRSRLLERLVPLATLAVLVALVALAGSAGSESFERTVTNVLITLVIVVGLYVFVGNSGVLSFGHIAFMALGAYTTAWLTIPVALKEATLPNLPGFLASAQTSGLVALLISGVVAAVFAAIVAAPITRLSGIAAGIATLSVLVVVNVVLSNWDDLTNGTGTIVGVPTNATIGSTLPWALGALVVAYLFQLSRWGIRLRATREDAVAARAVGISVVRERRRAFVLSAFFVGVGGSLYAQFLGAFNPGQFYIDLTFLTLAMLVVGGIRSLSGAVVGTLVVSALSELLRTLQEDGLSLAGAHLQVRAGLREIVLALLMLLILVVRPQGITRGRELGERWVRRLRRAVPQVPASAVDAAEGGAAR